MSEPKFGAGKAEQFLVRWHDAGREPECKPNPLYPEGIDVDCSDGRPACKAILPYPARRIGLYFVECKLCQSNGVCTTAGRPDDPRSITIPCKLNLN